MNDTDPKTVGPSQLPNTRRTFKVRVEPAGAELTGALSAPPSRATADLEVDLTEDESRVFLIQLRNLVEEFGGLTHSSQSSAADVEDIADESFDRDLNRIIDENRELLERLAR